MKRTRVVPMLAVMLLLFAAIFFGLTHFEGAEAGPQIVGNPVGAADQLIVTEGETVKRIEYFAAGAKTMVGADTPVASDPNCGNFGDLHAAEVRVIGTMTGTAPTLTFLWRNSLDGGVTWTNVGTWTVVNATVTPPVQNQVVSDQYSTTATAYGDCWDFTYSLGGTGTVTANFSVFGLEK